MLLIKGFIDRIAFIKYDYYLLLMFYNIQSVQDIYHE